MNRTTFSIITIFALLTGALVAHPTKADATETVTPGFQEPVFPPVPGRKLRSVNLSGTSVIGGAPLSGRVLLQFLAPQGGTTVALALSSDSILPEDLESPKVQLPSSVVVPASKSDATFSITTFPVLTERHITVQASAGGITRTATFTIEPLQVASLIIVPPAGLGPFQAQGTVSLTLPAPGDTNVSLTSSNPAVVRFGTFGSAQDSTTLQFHQGEAFKTFSIVASPVPQTATVTISATLNGKTVTRGVAVRH